MYYRDKEEQRSRRKKINKAFLLTHGEDLEKCDIKKWDCWGLKENVWILFALAEQGSKYAKTIEAIFTEKSEDLNEYHTFLSFMFIHLLLSWKEKFPSTVCRDMENHIKSNADLSMCDCWDFMGVNDNTPAMIAAALILSGEYFGEQRWIACGRKRLVQLYELLERREFLSEFNSPTYTPITICAVALVGEWSRSCSEIALEIEAKLWRQFLATAYLPVSNSAGAFSRAYPRDKLCETHNSRALLYMLFGDSVTVTPLNTVFHPGYTMDAHERLYIQTDMVWMCSFSLHCPTEIAQEFLHRAYPYRNYGKAEISSSADTYLMEPIRGSAKGDYPIRRENLLRTDTFSAFETDDCFEYPCAVSEIYTYMTGQYALGTCTTPFHSGVQTDSFTLCYTKNGKQAQIQDEIGSVYCNYCVNCDVAYRNDGGRKIAFQKDNHAMVLYSPVFYSDKITQAKLSIYFSNYKNMIESVVSENGEIQVAKLKEGQRITIAFGHVFLKLNSIFCHIRPLVNKKDIQDAYMELTVDGEQLILNIYNYKGEERGVKAKEFRSFTNGFVFNVEKSSDIAFSDFRKKYKIDMVSDKVICNVHNRYTFMREVKYQCGDTQLACCSSPINSGIKYIDMK